MYDVIRSQDSTHQRSSVNSILIFLEGTEEGSKFHALVNVVKAETMLKAAGTWVAQETMRM